MLATRLFFFLLVTGSLASDLPAQQKRLYLANDEHTDFMWTADAATYERVFQEMIDFHLDLCEATEKNPAPFQNRFNLDGSYWLWVYERQRAPAEFERVIERVKDGHFSAPLNTLVSCYGGQPAEAVLRGMYFAGRLERRYGLRFRQAIAMENQTLPLGLASLWAGSGAEYSWRGVCGCASRLPQASLQQRDHEIYWYTGHDQQRVLMKWHSLHPEGSRASGGYGEAFDPAAAVNFLDRDEIFLSRYRAPGAASPYSVRGAFGFGWDALDRKPGLPYADDPEKYPATGHFHEVAERETTPERQVIVSNEIDFFDDFAAHYGEQLPAETVTHGNEWDLLSASMAETSARVRRSVEKLRAAEALAALVSLKQPGFLERFETARDQAFTNLGLYWEHDWTADGPVPRQARARWQVMLADQIEEYVDTLHTEAAQGLGGLIAGQGKLPRFYVFNPLGWTRTDAADFEYAGPEDIQVQDLGAGKDVPHQFIVRDGTKRLRILAADLPPVGYKVFEIRKGRGTAPVGEAAKFSRGVFENSRVRLELEPDGAIRSLRDRSHPETELAATIGGLMLNDFAADDTGGGGFAVEESGPVSVTVKCESSAGCHHITRVTLFRDSPRVDIRNEITGNFGDVRHWVFSFDLPAPEVHAEEIGAVIRVKTRAEGGDYADRNARYDYATLNHFADISDGKRESGVTLSNADCAFVKLGNSTPETLDAQTAQLNVLAGGQVDGPALGISGQFGATHFLQRFALLPHRGYDQTSAMKFALEHQNPPVTGKVVGGGSETAWPETDFSLLGVSHPDVLLWALKIHDDGHGHGLVARVWNQAPTPAAVRFLTPLSLWSVERLTHIETPVEAVALKDGVLETLIGANRMESFGLRFEVE